MTETADIAVSLPLPPSANVLWRHRRLGSRTIMHRSKEYEAWLTTAGWECKAQARGRSCPFRYRLRITVPQTRRDLDNFAKPIGDLLQKQRLVADDKHMRELVLRVDPGRGDVLVELWALLDPAPMRQAALVLA